MDTGGIICASIMTGVLALIIIGIIVAVIWSKMKQKKAILKKAYLVHFVKAGVYDLDKVKEPDAKDRLTRSGLKVENFVVQLNRGYLGLAFFGCFTAVTLFMGIVSLIFGQISPGIPFTILGLIFGAVTYYFYSQRYYYACSKCYRIFAHQKITYRGGIHFGLNPITLLGRYLGGITEVCPYCEESGIKKVYIRSKYGKEMGKRLLECLQVEKAKKKDKIGKRASAKPDNDDFWDDEEDPKKNRKMGNAKRLKKE